VLDSRHVFSAGGSEEGSFAPIHLGEISEKHHIEITLISAAFSVTHPKDSLLMYCYWDGEESWKHWVRVIGWDSDSVYFMNPRDPVYPCKRPTAQVTKWTRLLFKFTQHSDATFPRFAWPPSLITQTPTP
jgi:hypothetical protein